jgi:hypothetical protein
MFKIFSDISQVLRKEFDLNTTVGLLLTSGLTGTWVTLDSTGKAVATEAATGLAFPIWNESSRAGTVGAFTPDVVNTKRVTVIAGGKLFATTDQYGGAAISKGDPLTTGASGKLKKATIGSDPIVAYCVKAQYSLTQFGVTYNVIDIFMV